MGGRLIEGKSCLSLVESEARSSQRERRIVCQGLRRMGCVVMAARRDRTGCWPGLESSAGSPAEARDPAAKQWVSRARPALVEPGGKDQWPRSQEVRSGVTQAGVWAL